ncbi:Protein BUD31-like [Hondaea fermentalgiana]|uniref:Protein BUD31-like n=1 Tax=Hondaea fermentalgiana TaxID=2315210 RepID=A0A2R5GIP1_9STRA|nr:Protein BUD31-like [Hondaea fermentalgiana]|eukprot:GBG30756.1 Protein BUD31-like [Hondaea fermentalgiana]
MSKWGRRKARPPPGFEDVEPTLTALEDEQRQRMEEEVAGMSKAEILWPVHQINWQKSRYIYKLYYKYERISKAVYDYCLDQKLVDKALIAKWKKPGYERLCSTYVINPRNYPYGTTAACRVPLSQRKQGSSMRDATTGCRGCASGAEGYSNIFGNKYGQDLAKLQILRERFEAKQDAIEANAKRSAQDDALDAVSKSRPTWASETQSKVLELENDKDVDDDGTPDDADDTGKLDNENEVATSVEKEGVSSVIEQEEPTANVAKQDAKDQEEGKAVEEEEEEENASALKRRKVE